MAEKELTAKASEIEDLNSKLEASTSTVDELTKKLGDKESELTEAKQRADEAEDALSRLVAESRLEKRVKRITEIFQFGDDELEKIKADILDKTDEEFEDYIEQGKKFAVSLLEKAKAIKKSQISADDVNPDEDAIAEILDDVEESDDDIDINSDADFSSDSVEASMKAAFAELYPSDDEDEDDEEDE